VSEERGRDKVLIGNEGRGYVALNILDRPKDGWMTAAIEIFADVSRGRYQGDFHSGELSVLAQGLE
jgi:hypothetical protein